MSEYSQREKEKDEGLDSALCAKFNFENLERQFPAIKNHPYYQIAKYQLDWGLWRAWKLEGLEPELTRRDAR